MKFKIAEPIIDEAYIEAQLIIDEDGNLNLMIADRTALMVSKDTLAATVESDSFLAHPELKYFFIWKEIE